MSRGKSLAAALERSRTAAGGLAVDEARPRRIVPVALDAIRIEARLRGRLDAEQVARIAESMREIGLQSSVVLRPHREPEGGRRETGLFALVAGAHRIKAARKLGWTVIEALVIDVPPDEARLVEIDENLARAELSALARARFLAARKEIYERPGNPARRGQVASGQLVHLLRGRGSGRRRARGQVGHLLRAGGRGVRRRRRTADRIVAADGAARRAERKSPPNLRTPWTARRWRTGNATWKGWPECAPRSSAGSRKASGTAASRRKLSTRPSDGPGRPERKAGRGGAGLRRAVDWRRSDGRGA